MSHRINATPAGPEERLDCVVSDINQISVAFGQAAVAAVRVHNALDDEA